MKYIKIKSLNSFDSLKKSNKEVKLKYIQNLWKRFNKEKFGGKLKYPKFRWLRNRKGKKTANLGYWEFMYDPSTGRVRDGAFAISQNIIDYFKNDKVLNFIMLHEMCHQAVTEIDNEPKADPHGFEWKHWAIKVGIKPDPMMDRDLYFDNLISS